MASLVSRTASKVATGAARPSRTSAFPVLPRVSAPVRSTRIIVRAAEEDPSAKFQEQLNDAVKFVQTKWEETSDAEKPAAVAIIIGAVIAQIAIGATVDAVDRLPLIHQFLEFVGLAVVGVYGYRYFTDPSERDGVKKSIESFVAAVTGK